MSKMCLSCRGQKKVHGLGWMESECANCDGLGRVPDEQAIYKESLSESVTEALDDLDTLKDRSIYAKGKAKGHKK